MTVRGAGVYGGNVDWAGVDPLSKMQAARDYDDHIYCGACDGHARNCWCFSRRVPGAEDEAADRLCPGGDGHGDPDGVPW